MIFGYKSYILHIGENGNLKKPAWKNGPRLLAAALALVVLCSCGGRSAADGSAVGTDQTPEEMTVPAATPSPERTENPPAEATAQPAGDRTGDGVHAEVPFDEMRWTVPDTAAFDAALDAMVAAETDEEMLRQYDAAVDELLYTQTQEVLCGAAFYSDVTDEAASEAMQSSSEISLEASDRLLAAASLLLQGSHAAAFRARIGEEDAEQLTEYESMSEELKQLFRRETALTSRYNTVVADGSLDPREKNRKLGDIFLELIDIRSRIAACYEYDSYADYAYAEIFGRDYGPEEAAELCRRIREVIPAYGECYYSDAFFVDWSDKGGATPDDCRRAIRIIAEEVSPEATAAAEYLFRNGLYLLREGDMVADIGYTAPLPFYNSGLIFHKFYDGDFMYNLQTGVHEFGHFYEQYRHPEVNRALLGLFSYDVLEIHSTGLEALFYDRMDEFFDEALIYSRIYTLESLLYNVISGCLYDEFLQYCYSHPDMTVEEINELNFELLQEYFGMEFEWNEELAWSWQDVPHNFETPFYYISYATSSLASLQLWDLSQTDRAAALESYERVVEAGGMNVSYGEVLAQAGLALFTEDLDSIVLPPYNELRRLCRIYDEQSRAA